MHMNMTGLFFGTITSYLYCVITTFAFNNFHLRCKSNAYGYNFANAFYFPLPVRTALVALIAFMPTIPGGALGSLDYSKEERRKLAIKSREAAPKYGNAERQKLIDQVSIITLVFLVYSWLSYLCNLTYD